MTYGESTHVEIPRWLLKCDLLPPLAKLLYAAIMVRAYDSNRRGRRELAAAVGWDGTDAQVDDELRLLLAGEFIVLDEWRMYRIAPR